MKRRSIDSPARTITGAQAVDRAVAILRAFGGRDAWPLTELAQSLALNKTTTFRLLGALERGGLVARDEEGAYRLGPDLLALAAHALRSIDLRDAARGELAALAAARYEGPGLPPLGRLARLTPRSIASAERLARELAIVHRRGWATAIGEVERDFVAIGAPVRNHERRVVAAISAGGPSTRLGPERIPRVAALVRRSADRISRRLGAPAAPHPPSVSRSRSARAHACRRRFLHGVTHRAPVPPHPSLLSLPHRHAPHRLRRHRRAERPGRAGAPARHPVHRRRRVAAAGAGEAVRGSRRRRGARAHRRGADGE